MDFVHADNDNDNEHNPNLSSASSSASISNNSNLQPEPTTTTTSALTATVNETAVTGNSAAAALLFNIDNIDQHRQQQDQQTEAEHEHSPTPTQQAADNLTDAARLEEQQQQQQEQVENDQRLPPPPPPPELIEANVIADTIDAGAIDNDNDNDAVVERIDDYDDEDEGEGEGEGDEDDLYAGEHNHDEEEAEAEDQDQDQAQEQEQVQQGDAAAVVVVYDAAAEVAASGGSSQQQRLHSVAVLPSYSTARAPLPPLLRAPRTNHNNNNNNNNNSSSGGSSRRTRHFYSNNGSHFSNDMYAGSHKSSSQSHNSPRTGGAGGSGAGSGATTSSGRNFNPTQQSQQQVQGVDPLRLLYPNVNESETPLPRCWSPHDKCLSIGLSHNNLRVTYKGMGKQHSEAAGSVRTAYPIPSSCGLYYFEVRIISKGRNGYMGIGLTAQQFRMNRLPGGDKQSYGYHGYDGNSFSSSCNGQSYGPTFTTGDVIGCCVNFVNNTCFYTKNGVDLGIAFRDLPTKLYPTVGLQTAGEEVDANFGQEPFKFDKIEEMMREMRANVLRKIDRYPHHLDTPENLMNRLVSTYLVHSGYCKTAEAFNGYTQQPFDEDLPSIKTRQKIIKLIQTGKMSQAIENTLRAYPGLLENNKNLWFALKCRQFIEMINGADVEHANNKVTATTQTMPTNQTSVIQSTKAFKHSKGGGSSCTTNQPQIHTANSAVIKPGDKTDPKIMIIDDNSNKCPEHDSNSMDVEMEPCNSHSNDVDVSPSSRNYGRVIEKILEFGKELSSMGQQLEKENLMTEEERQMLEDAFSLIAYSNPWSSPLGWLLCPSRRENVSTTLNSAILESLNFERRPPLEYLVAHAAELLKIIGQHSLGEDAFITIDDVFPQN
ncbi:ran-binding proteins 9/10 homolog isoform X2 [Drosophila grimshawi]|uniref:ran-binding proteins 9/10 homolog isoform X2 n=2 Tax=Drosophila grimshawi TaxID=7222 RepID=UPI000C86EDE3|nr:ran-binding proteins 9/10 homolog isoform X2 [Drosophila grimshawi]